MLQHGMAHSGAHDGLAHSELELHIQVQEHGLVLERELELLNEHG